MWNQRLTQMPKAECRLKALQLREEGLKNWAIARRLNVSDSLVSRILSEERRPAKRSGCRPHTGCKEV
jgi:predicted transcriptional regulator